MKKVTPKPTRSELEILQVLWKIGPSSVRTVHEALGKATGYTSILKFLQIMTEKGLVSREEEGRAHIYKPLINQQNATGDFVKELISRMFGGSRSKLVLEALNSGETSKEELREIRTFLKNLEEKKK